MIKGQPKEKCARCKALGIFSCEHSTPVRDKYRNMQLKQGRFYESPRDYEDLLEPSIYHDANAFGGDTGYQSHNALSFQRLLLNQKKFETDLQLKSMFDINKARRKEKKTLKLNSLRHNNQSLSRLSRHTPRKTPRSSVNGNRNSSSFKKPAIKFNDQDLFDNNNKNELNNKTIVEDLDAEKNNNLNNSSDKKKSNETNKDSKKAKNGCCTII